MKKINLLKTLAFSSLLLVGCGGGKPASSQGNPSSDNPTSDTSSEENIENVIEVPEAYKKDEKLTRYTESWRSVKSEGWGILKSVESNPAKLEAALKLFDYMYSDAGNELMSYGPKEYGYIETDANGNVVTIDYQGKQVPKLSAETLDQLEKLAKNNYTNYYRYFVGATLPIGYVKEQGMEYQCTHQAGKDGLSNINKNIELNTLRHPQVGRAVTDTRDYPVEKLAVNTKLSLSVLYKEKESEPKFVAGSKAPNGYTDPKGQTYSQDDWKPTWKALQERLNMSFTNTIVDKDVVSNYEKLLAESFNGIDIVTGKAGDITTNGPDNFLDLNKYLDRMPNFKEFLKNNPIVGRSIISLDKNNNNAIYYAPYFDGFNDIERMTLLRQDWLEKLLDAENPTYDETTTLETFYEPTIANDKYELTVAEGLTSNNTKVITKDQTKGNNIIDIQNKLTVKNGKTLTEALKNYIKDTYGNQYTKPSELFNSVKAAYDADEFIALLRCIKANPSYLTDGKNKNVVPFYPREKTNDRVSDLFRWGAQMWGAQGVESRSGFLFVKSEEDALIRDARSQVKTGEMLDNLHKIYKEGLILQNFETDTAAGGQQGRYNKDLGINNMGFATYDYCQTQTALNYEGYAEGQYKLIPVITPFTHWSDLEYIISPTTYKLTTDESTQIKGFAKLNLVTVEKGTQNLWSKYIYEGFGGVYNGETLVASPEALVELMKEYKVETVESFYSSAYELMI